MSLKRIFQLNTSLDIVIFFSALIFVCFAAFFNFLVLPKLVFLGGLIRLFYFQWGIMLVGTFGMNMTILFYALRVKYKYIEVPKLLGIACFVVYLLGWFIETMIIFFWNFDGLESKWIANTILLVIFIISLGLIWKDSSILSRIATFFILPYSILASFYQIQSVLSIFSVRRLAFKVLVITDISIGLLLLLEITRRIYLQCLNKTRNEFFGNLKKIRKRASF